MGHQVKILASLMSFDENGDRCFLPEPTEYQNEDGITVQRLNYKNPRKIGKLFRKYEGTYEALCQYEPELIFIHGVQFSDIY